MYGEGGYRPRNGPRGGSGGGFSGGFGGDGGFAPVKVGEELDVKIEAVGEKGDGIARKRGFVLFVPNTKEGDEVRIRVTKVLRKVGFAEVLGPAQGAPEADHKPEPRREEAARPMPEEHQQPEDSENFGEESENLDTPPVPDDDFSAEEK